MKTLTSILSIQSSTAARGLWACALVVACTLAAMAQSEVTFTRITAGPVATDTESSVGVSWVDMDGDGDVDLFVANGIYSQGRQTNAVYRNDQGVFTRLGAGAAGAIADLPAGWAVGGWGDLDNDGLVDALVTGLRDGVAAPMPTAPLTEAYRNVGDCRFERWPQMFGTTNLSVNLSLADYDQDGWVDVFMGTAHMSYLVDRGVLDDSSRVSTNTLYRNLGGTQLAPLDAAELTEERVNETQAAAWGDFDGDGDVDLVVTLPIYSGRIRLYENLGGGSFRQAQATGLGDPLGLPVVPIWADYNNDGRLDLVVSVVQGPCALFRNEGSGRFSRHSLGTGAEHLQPAWGDYDNDGWLDLFVSCGESQAQVNRLWHNNGDGTLTPILSGGLVTEPGISRGAAWGDYDNDGFLDLVVARAGRNLVYHNDGNGNHWFKVDLKGTLSNRSAIGAKVTLEATIGGKTLRQLREISSGSRCQDDPRAHFGLGDATNVTTLRIEWPSGTVQEFNDLAANQIMQISESRPPRLHSVHPTTAGFEGKLAANPDRSYFIYMTDNLEGPATTWTSSLPLVWTDAKGNASWSDPGPVPTGHRFYKAQEWVFIIIFW